MDIVTLNNDININLLSNLIHSIVGIAIALVTTSTNAEDIMII